MTADRPFIIYMHTSPSGKRYVGQTSKDLKVRWRNGSGYIGNTYFYRAIKKYGWENIKHEILCVVHSEKMAHLFERYYIAKFDTTDRKKGYNLTLGGEGTLGHVVSEEARKKISEATTGNTWDEQRKKDWSSRVKGKNNPMYGRRHSPETIALMSANRAKVPFTEEMREKKTAILLEATKKRQVSIRQLDLNGNLIATYDSYSEAEQKTGFGHGSIWKACNGILDQSYGYRWEFQDEELRAKAEEARADRKGSKKDRIRGGKRVGGMAVVQLDLAGNEVARYSSLSDAERKTGLHRDRIGDCCHGGLESYGGFGWKFENEDQQGAETSAVIQRDLDGNEIARFPSLAKASASTGIPRYQIRHVCCGRQKTTHGFMWEFVDKSQLANAPKQRIGVVQLDMDGNEVASYKSISEAMRQTGQDKHMIADCCKGVRHSYRRTRWQYAEVV